MSAYNYAAAFMLFSQGQSFADISISLGIPLDTLEGEARQHGWKKLCHRLQLAQPPLPVERSLDAVNKNRLKSLKEAEPLEKTFEYILELNGQMQAELEYWNGMVDRHRAEFEAAEVDHTQCPTAESTDSLRKAGEMLGRASEIRDTLRMYLATPRRFKELAQGLAQIHEMRYRALGDAPNVQVGAKTDAARTLTQIIVNMPSVVAKPRQVVDRSKVIEAEPTGLI